MRLTFTEKSKKRTQAYEMRSYRRLFNITYKAHVTSEEVLRKILAAIGEYDELMTLPWSGNKKLAKFDQA